MAHLGYLFVAAFVAILAISTQETSALQCWSCNNFQSYCGESFDSKEADKSRAFQDCPNGRCVKQVKSMMNNGKETITVNRLCVATPQLAEENCKEKDVKFCQACETDKCNGAAQYGPVAVLVVAIPVIVTKIFAF